MTIKAYDKIMDLIGRDGCKAVGSRLRKVLGTGRVTGCIEERVRKG